MASAHKFSEQVIEAAERLADIADAAQGKRIGRRRRGFVTLLLPASGAALYAFARSEFVSRRAKGVVDEAKTRASELPNDLIKSARQAGQKPRTPSQNAGNSSGRGQTAARRKARARRSPTSARNSRST